MTDTRTKKQRRYIMQAVKGKNTRPEMVVRRILHKMGYRYRLHDKRLPGKPDIVFNKRKRVIFVHGCFWHMHNCNKGRPPKSNERFWNPKLAANKQRDLERIAELKAFGWSVLTLWECELKETEALRQHLVNFLEKDGR